uniref:Uncharacterized protein n=1 Tax=Triticum urartu TaxID=4572 RepID=A0A8R7Q2U5_TRIUA
MEGEVVHHYGSPAPLLLPLLPRRLHLINTSHLLGLADYVATWRRLCYRRSLLHGLCSLSSQPPARRRHLACGFRSAEAVRAQHHI